MNPLSGTVTIPAVGPVQKKVLIPVVGAAAAFIGWRYWQARGGTGADEGDAAISDGEFGAVDSSIPGVIGAVSPTNSYGSNSGEDANPNTVDDYGFTGTTNAQWTQYAATQLSQSDKWSYTDILVALGNFINGKPLDSAQQSIVQAAIAVAGYPPVGSHVIVPGGNVPLTQAPSGLSVVKRDSQSVTIAFKTVPGAVNYVAFRGVGAAVAVSGGSPITVAGLQPATSYKINVAGKTASGATGPHSSMVTVKTLSAPKKK